MIKIYLSAALLFVSSCSFLNDKTVSVPITSNPSGANIYINGKHYGVTPATVKLEPRKDIKYTATLVKEGYGKASINMETWASVRGERGGEDKSRCMADTAGFMFVIPAIALMSVHCRDFKLKEYSVNIPRTELSYGRQNNSSYNNNNQQPRWNQGYQNQGYQNQQPNSNYYNDNQYRSGY